MDIVETLKAENESIKEVLEKVRAEFQAIDMTYVESIKLNISLKAQILLINKKLNQKCEEIEKVQAELDEIKKVMAESETVLDSEPGLSVVNE